MKEMKEMKEGHEKRMNEVWIKRKVL